MISPQEVQVLADLIAIVNSLNLPMMLVGAGARLLIFDRKFGAGRATKDWDVAISIDSWQGYEQLRQALIEGDYPLFQGAKTSHKFIHIQTKIEVDIVPFGKIGEPQKKITWPDQKNGNSMNILGFIEAFSSAESIKINEDWEVKVINIPALIVLKVFAWGDRGTRTQKDLEDIDLILSKYEDNDPDRVYQELVEELVDGVVDFLNANIYLLGQDIAKHFQSNTILELNRLLDKLIEDLVNFNIDDSNFPYLGDRLKILKQGIGSRPNI